MSSRREYLTQTLLCAVLMAACRNGPSDPAPTAATSPATATAASVSGPASGTAEVAAAASTGSPEPPPPPPPPLVQLAEEGPVEVIDLHVDTPWKVHFKNRPLSLPAGHATIEALQKGHYAAIVYPIYIPDYLHGGHPTVADAEAIFGTVEKLIATHQALQPAKEGPVDGDAIAAFLAIEGAGAFAAKIEAIDGFIARGVRLVGPVHAQDNDLAGSATGARRSGLSELGKRFCRRVYEKGALIDVSHMSSKSFSDLADIAEELKVPIVATHSNARALADHPRNLSDEQLKRIAASGGVTGLNLHRNFVAKGTVGMAQVVAQVKHMVAVAGIDHVALGSDYDGGNPVPGLDDAGHWGNLAEALRDAGMSDADLRKVFGKNALRILTWKK